MAAPICGLALQAQLDPDTRDWLSRRLLLPGVGRAVCEAAAEQHKPAGTPVMTEAEMASEVARDKAVRDQLLSELESVRAERDALDEQRQALQSALEELAKRPPTTVVQQEVKYAESWDAKIAELLAARTTERVLEVMQQPIATGADATPSSSIQLGIVSDEGLDLSKEPAMADSVSVELAQERLRALLLELHHRTRLEGVRLSEAIRATEEAATRQHLLALSQKMSEQEAYVQQLTEQKASEIREKTIKEIQERDLEFRRGLRRQWAKSNEETLKLAHHNIKLKNLHYSLQRQGDLERSKQELADFFTKEAQENALQMLQLEESIKKFDSILVADCQVATQAQLIHRLSLCVQGLGEDLERQRPLSSHMIALRKLAQGDPVVATAVGSIPSAAGKEGVVSAQELQQRYLGAAHEALRMLLVPEIGGVVAELVGTVRLRLLQVQGPVLPVSDSLVDGSDTKTVLQRGLYYVRNGLLHKALEEIASLEGSASYAMSGWVQQAQTRLQVEQAQRLLEARTAALCAAMPRAGPSGAK